MKRYTIAFLSFLTCLCLLVFSGCGGGGGGGSESGSDDGNIPNYLCFTANTANCQLSMKVTVSSYPHIYNPPVLEFSTDGKNWKSFNSESNTFEWLNFEKAGDKVYLRGDNPTFSFDDEYYSFMTYGSFKVSGNIMSLLDKSLKLKTIPSDNCFKMLFDSCDIISAPELPATVLSDNCYFSMFRACSNLVKAPALPALTLAEECYSCMFAYCSSLIATPELPATVLVNSCYQSMFLGCTSLTEVQSLPADIMARYCYGSMFALCSSLTSTPELPAINLAEGCYFDMFEGCTGLASAPVLPATVLKDDCYRSMFHGCERLKSITVGFLNWNGATDATFGWVEGVDDTGTFRCPVGLAEETGVDRIPSGWTKINL